MAHVALTDPDWFYWAYHEDVFRGQVLAEARLLYEYARTIRVGLSKGKCYEYRVGSEVKVAVVSSKTQMPGNSEVKITRSKVLDLEFPRLQEGYDPEQYGPYLDSVQKILFGKITKPYVKKDVCERFFATPKNFTHQAKTGRRK